MNVPPKYNFRIYFLENQTPISTISAEAGTTETNITITNHGLETDDFIINTTKRSTPLIGEERGSRRITKVDNNNFTISPGITDQGPGDAIMLGKFIDRTSLVKQQSLKMNFRSNNDSVVNFDMILQFNPITRYNYNFYKDQYVRIKLNSDWIFTGTIKGTTIKLIDEKLNYSIFSVKVYSLKNLLKYRTIRLNQDIGDNTTDIINTMIGYLAQEGLIAGTIGAGIDIEEDWKNDCISISDVIERCNKKNSFQFIINHDFTCDWFDEPSTISNAPYTIEDGGSFIDYSKVVVNDEGEYLNKSFLVGGMDSNGNQVFAIKGDLTEQNNYQKRSFGTGVKGKIIRDSSNVEITEYTAEIGTTSTNLNVSGHDFEEGDYIYNWTQETSTFVTSIVDVDNVTTEEVAGQTEDDLIIRYPTAQKTVNTELKKNVDGYKTISFKTNTWGFLPYQKLTVLLEKMLINSYEYYVIEEVNFNDDGARNYSGFVKASKRDNGNFSTQPVTNFAKGFFTEF